MLSGGASLVAQIVNNLPATWRSGFDPWVGNIPSLQYSFLENPMNRGAWRSSPWGHKELDRTERLTLCNCEHAVWCSQKIEKRRGLIIKCIIFRFS